MARTAINNLKARWTQMVNRCHNPAAANYAKYGGRGIVVCERWRNDFHAFLQDVGVCPGDDLSLDRIDNGGNYEPGNVRWATRIEQSNNRRKAKRDVHGWTGKPTHAPLRSMRVWDEEWEHWQQLAEERHVTVSELIRQQMRLLAARTPAAE